MTYPYKLKFGSLAAKINKVDLKSSFSKSFITSSNNDLSSIFIGCAVAGKLSNFVSY